MVVHGLGRCTRQPCPYSIEKRSVSVTLRKARHDQMAKQQIKIGYGISGGLGPAQARDAEA
jgi:hypothetical protein